MAVSKAGSFARNAYRNAALALLLYAAGCGTAVSGSGSGTTAPPVPSPSSPIPSPSPSTPPSTPASPPGPDPDVPRFLGWDLDWLNKNVGILAGLTAVAATVFGIVFAIVNFMRGVYENKIDGFHVALLIALMLIVAVSMFFAIPAFS